VQVKLIDKKGNSVSGEILKARQNDLKGLKEWKFNWVELAKSKKSNVYKLETQEIEALLIIQFIDDEFFESTLHRF